MVWISAPAMRVLFEFVTLLDATTHPRRHLHRRQVMPMVLPASPLSLCRALCFYYRVAANLLLSAFACVVGMYSCIAYDVSRTTARPIDAMPAAEASGGARRQTTQFQ